MSDGISVQWPTVPMVAAVLVALAKAAGAGSAAAQIASLRTDCVGSGGGAACVTDSELTVYENDTDGTTDRFYFPEAAVDEVP